MRATSPAEMHSRFAEAFNAGDREALLALYEPEATYVAGPEQLATGTAQLSAAFQQLLALKGHPGAGDEVHLAVRRPRASHW